MLIIPLSSKIADNPKNTTGFIISFCKPIIPTQISTTIIKVYNTAITQISEYLIHLLTFLSSIVDVIILKKFHI